MEFFISESEHASPGSVSIIGRCGADAVRPGVEFRAILREKPRCYPDGLEKPREIEQCKNIFLKVKEIEAYGRKVEFLPPNTTGILRCVDCSTDFVPGGWILTDQCVTGGV